MAGRQLLIRGSLLIHGDSVASYMNTLKVALTEVRKLPDEGGWSEAAVDDLLATSLVAVLSGDIDGQHQTVKQTAEEFVKQLGSPPPSWKIHLPIYGLAPDCSGLSFGLVTFVAGIIELNDFLTRMMPPRSSEGAMLAQLEVKGRDKTSAVDRAVTLLEEHLTILNALCSDGYPGHVRLTSGTADCYAHQVYRATSDATPDDSQSGLRRTVTRLPLTRADYETRMSKHGGQRVGDWLANPTEFGERLLSGYVLAGTACTDTLPQRSFLLFAIALESIVLGKSKKAEIGFQLSIHVANLVGDGLDRKRSVRKEVNDVYGIRSAIAHAGKNDVVGETVEQMRQLCLRALLSVTVSSAFSAMTMSRELDEWLTDRLLDSPSHLADLITSK